MAQDEKIIIHRNTGESFILVPLEEKDANTLISNHQKNAIDKALKSIEKGKTFSNEEAQKKLSSIHPKYFK